jgi:hypothetical protein
MGAPSMIMAQVARWFAIWFCRRRLLCSPGRRWLVPLYTRDLGGKGKARVRGTPFVHTWGPPLGAQESPSVHGEPPRRDVMALIWPPPLTTVIFRRAAGGALDANEQGHEIHQFLVHGPTQTVQIGHDLGPKYIGPEMPII